MLTKTDLSQIRTVVKEEVKTATKNTTTELRKEIKFIRLDNQNALLPLKNGLKIVETAVVKIQKDVNTIISFFDRQDVDTLKRVKRIEEHLGLPMLQ